MHATAKLFVQVSQVKDNEVVRSQRFECKSFTRWAKIFLANLAAAAGFDYAGGGTINYTRLSMKDIDGVVFDEFLGVLTCMMYASACGQSDEAFDEEQFFLSDFVAFADYYEKLTDLTLENNTVKFSMRSYFVVVDDFTMKEACLLGLAFDDVPDYHLICISRDLLETPYECKTDEVYIVDYEMIFGAG